MKPRRPKIYFTTDEYGEPVYENNGLLDRVLKSLKSGVRHYIEIKKYVRNRSLEQNAYYFSVVLKIIGDDLGYTKDEMHQLMAERFLSYEKNGQGFVKSTTQLATVEMEEYLKNIRMFASMELNIYIPLPNEKNWTDI